MVSQKEAQKMASDLAYKKDNEMFIHNHSCDPTGFDVMEHQYLKEGEASRKSAKLIKPDMSYDGNIKAVELKDDNNLKDRTEAQKLASDNRYKREAAAEMHAVNGCQVTDTPWQIVADEAQ
jgi:aspartate/tyrosine/aromatic aminotransferase